MMKVRSGKSTEVDSHKAIEEASSSWPNESPDFIFVFHSTVQNAEQVAKDIQEKFPGAMVAGCTTSGEHLNGEHLRGSLVMTGIWSQDIRWQVTVLENLDQLTEQRAREAADQVIAGLGLTREQLSPEQQFCITFIDGLSLKEEMTSAYLAGALDGIPLLGGSAGDDLKFEKTMVIANGRAYQKSAVLVMADSKIGFHVIKHQHFKKTPSQLVVTKVDSPQRRVYELDGMVARDAYAQALNLSPEEVTPEICFVNPLLFRVNHEFYVRSIQRIEDDGSIIFYCGVEEGMVLEVGGQEVIENALEKDLDVLKTKINGQAEFFLACNCILRALEAEKDQKHQALGKIFTGIGKNVIGFDTYGEQLNGLHINQTLVGLVLGRAA
ncbi:MAG: FIST N-terminal domain-containing protein [Oligoflexus sp.]